MIEESTIDLWLKVPFLLAFFQGLIISQLIFKRKQNAYLALFILIISFGALFDTQTLPYNSLIKIIWNGNEFLYGPLLYLAVRKQLNLKTYKIHLHFYVFIFMKLLSLITIIFPNISEKFPLWLYHALSILLVAHGLLYVFLCYFKLNSTKNLSSSLESNWLKYLVSIFLLSFITALISRISLLSNITLAEWLFYFVYIFALIAIYYVSYVLNDRIFATNFPPSKTIDVGKPSKVKKVDTNKKYSKSTLSEKRISENKEKIDLYFNSKQYLDLGFTFGKLSEELDITQHHLSQTFNIGFRTTYYDYVKKLRISEAAKRILDEKFSHLTVYAIALDCGFNSKSAFNRAFREITGNTPSEYRKNHTA